MAEDKKESLWYRLWDHRSLKEKRRLRSLVPWILYGIAVFYGIIYLSILNTVNREKTGTTVLAVKKMQEDQFEDLSALNSVYLQLERGDGSG